MNVPGAVTWAFILSSKTSKWLRRNWLVAVVGGVVGGCACWLTTGGFFATSSQASHERYSIILFNICNILAIRLQSNMFL